MATDGSLKTASYTSPGSDCSSLLELPFLTPIFPAMNYADYEVELAEHEPRPLKRPRQRKEGDDGHRPYNPQSGPSGVHSEVDDSVEGNSRKGRKRPLSCGECRRCVCHLYSPLTSFLSPLCVADSSSRYGRGWMSTPALPDPASPSATAPFLANHAGSEAVQKYVLRVH